MRKTTSITLDRHCCFFWVHLSLARRVRARVRIEIENGMFQGIITPRIFLLLLLLRSAHFYDGFFSLVSSSAFPLITLKRFCLFCKTHFSSRWLNACVIRFIKSFIIAVQSMWFTLYTAFQFVNIDSHSYFNGSYQWMVSFSWILSIILFFCAPHFPVCYHFHFISGFLFSSSHCCISVWCLFIVYLYPFRYSFNTNGTK